MDDEIPSGILSGTLSIALSYKQFRKICFITFSALLSFKLHITFAKYIDVTETNMDILRFEHLFEVKQHLLEWVSMWSERRGCDCPPDASPT